MRKSLRVLTVLGLVTGLLMAFTLPASAFIHEIVGSFCANSHTVPSPTGNIHNPPGITSDLYGGVSAADNATQPLIASGAYDITEVDSGTTFWIATLSGLDTTTGPARLLELDDTQPQVKFESPDVSGETPVYLPLGGGDFLLFTSFEDPTDTLRPDSDFAAFANCEIGNQD